MRALPSPVLLAFSLSSLGACATRSTSDRYRWLAQQEQREEALLQDAVQRRTRVRALLDGARCAESRAELERAKALGAEDMEWTELEDDLSFCD